MILSHTKWGKRLDAYEWYVLVVLLQETGRSLKLSLFVSGK